MYICSVLYVTPDFVKDVDKSIFYFLWPQKVHVKRDTVIGPICEGGLPMPEFSCKIKATKVMWM